MASPSQQPVPLTNPHSFRGIARRALSAISAAVDRIAGYFHISAKYVKACGVLTVFGFGSALVGVGEYLLALLPWFVAVVLAAVVMWPNKGGSFRRFKIVAIVIASLVSFALLTTWIVAKKGDDPWTNFSRLHWKGHSLITPKSQEQDVGAKSQHNDGSNRDSDASKSASASDVAPRAEHLSPKANRLTTKSVQPKDPWDLAKWRLANDPSSLTLYDLYLSDFTAPVKVGGHRTLTTPDGGTISFQATTVQQLDSGGEFLQYYIPNSDRTLELLLWIASNHKNEIARAHEDTVSQKTPGDSTPSTSRDLYFTGRVFVYHEQYLTAEDIGHLTETFKQNGLSVHFRGADYLSQRKKDELIKQLTKNPRGVVAPEPPESGEVVSPDVQVFLGEQLRIPATMAKFRSAAELQRALPRLAAETAPRHLLIRQNEDSIVINVILRNTGGTALKNVTTTIDTSVPVTSLTEGVPMFSPTQVRFSHRQLRPYKLMNEELYYSFSVPTKTPLNRIVFFATVYADNLEQVVGIVAVEFEKK